MTGSPSVVGIDPGANGALAWLSVGGDLDKVDPMPTVKKVVNGRIVSRVSAVDLATLLRRYSAAIIRLAVVERVASMPGQGVASMFAFGRSSGVIEGALAMAGIEVAFVEPAVWKRSMQVTSAKVTSVARAQAIWPEMAGQLSEDGPAEAALIGLYGLRANRGKVEALSC